MCTYHKTYLVQNSLEKEKFMLDKIVQQNVLIFAIYLLKYEKKHVVLMVYYVKSWQSLKQFVRKFHQALNNYFGRVTQYKMHE